jgi:hypothetical protein
MVASSSGTRVMMIGRVIRGLSFNHHHGHIISPFSCSEQCASMLNLLLMPDIDFMGCKDQLSLIRSLINEDAKQIDAIDAVWCLIVHVNTKM